MNPQIAILILVLLSFPHVLVARHPFAFIRTKPLPTAGGGGGGPITVVQTQTATNGTTNGYSIDLVFNSATTVGNSVIIFTGGYLVDDVIQSVTGCGATFSKVTSGSQTDNNIEIWQGKCTTSETTFTATGNWVGNLRVSLGMEVANLSDSVDSTATPNYTGGWTMSMSLFSPSLDHEMLVVAAGVISKGVTTFASAPTNGFTQIGVINAGSGGTQVSILGAYKIVTTSGTHSTSWSAGSGGSPSSTVLGATLD